MMTITFNAGGTIEAQEVVPTNQEGIISIGSGNSFDPYDISDIRSIMPDMSIPYKDRLKAPTDLQATIVDYLQKHCGYQWNKQKSTAAAGVVLDRRIDEDFWFFGMNGEIMRNPEVLLSIKL